MYKRLEFQARVARLRADYDAAFRTLCRAMSELQSSIEGRDEASTQSAEGAADCARAACTRARNALAEFLLERKLHACAIGEGRTNRNGHRRSSWTNKASSNRPASHRGLM